MVYEPGWAATSCFLQPFPISSSHDVGLGFHFDVVALPLQCPSGVSSAYSEQERFGTCTNLKNIRKDGEELTLYMMQHIIG